MLLIVYDSVVYVSCGEPFVGKPAASSSSPAGLPASVKVIASKSYIEEEAVKQLERTALLPGMQVCAGMPDLHPGKGFPVGAAFATTEWIYPALIGGDIGTLIRFLYCMSCQLYIAYFVHLMLTSAIGCGMTMYRTSIPPDVRPSKVADALAHLESPWTDGSAPTWLSSRGIAPTPFDALLGTIGGGNHFAELQRVERIVDADAAAQAGIAPDALYLLVHSGSRGLGAQVLDAHVAKHQAGGLRAGSEEAAAYMARHDHACEWARASRSLIAFRFFNCLAHTDTLPEPILDIWHNNVERIEFSDGRMLWLHRKGAAPSNRGLIVIPGSRGAASYVVLPTGAQDENAFSVAHGAGRKLSRSKGAHCVLV